MTSTATSRTHLEGSGCASPQDEVSGENRGAIPHRRIAPVVGWDKTHKMTHLLLGATRSWPKVSVHSSAHRTVSHRSDAGPGGVRTQVDGLV